MFIASYLFKATDISGLLYLPLEYFCSPQPHTWGPIRLEQKWTGRQNKQCFCPGLRRKYLPRAGAKKWLSF